MRKLSETLGGNAILLSELLQSVVEPTLERAGISLAAFELLNAIHSGQGKATQAQVAATLKVTPPTLCEAVKGAVRQGLVAQIEDQKDRRTKKLELTAKSKRILAKAFKAISEAEEAMVKDIDPEQLEAAVLVLTQAVVNIARYDAAQARD